MIVLSNTTDRINVVLNTTITTNQLRCVVAWRDRTSTTFTADRTIINTNNTTDVNITGSPAASTQRLIDYISIFNTDTTTKTVTIKFDANGTQYNIIVATLLTNETIDFCEGRGWVIYTAAGVVKSTQNAAGAPTEVQYNNGGILTASPNFTYDSTTNDLLLSGADPTFRLGIITTEPTAPPAGHLNIYAKSVAGRVLPKWKGPSGLDTIIQPALFGNNTVVWNPGATSGTMTGSVQTVVTAGAAVLPTTTNQYTALRRSTFTVATGANLQNSIRSEAMFFRGAGGAQGGFFMFQRFGFNTWTTGNRLFIGFSVGTTAVTTVDPSTLLNMCGFGVDAADSAISFMHNDGVGAATKVALSGQPALATNNGYDMYIFARPSDNTIFYRLDNILTGLTIAEGSVNTDMPVNTTMMGVHAAIGSGANAGAAAAVLGLNRIYVETDY